MEGEAPCYYCGKVVAGRQLSRDHFIPKSKGGTNRKSNIVLCCLPCNSTKNDALFEDVRWRLVLKMLGWPKFELVELAWLRTRGFDMGEYDRARLWFEREQTDIPTHTNCHNSEEANSPMLS